MQDLKDKTENTEYSDLSSEDSDELYYSQFKNMSVEEIQKEVDQMIKETRAARRKIKFLKFLVWKQERRKARAERKLNRKK